MTELIEKRERIRGFDFIRITAILIVFLGHTIGNQRHNQYIELVIKILSPGLTMSLLGFVSGYLLSIKYQLLYDGLFYIKRLVRIFSSLFICLSFITILHAFLGKDVINQHSFFHFMGLTAFFDLFQVESQSSLGEGLWFVTVIVAMYLLLPMLSTILSHRNGNLHLFFIISFCLFLNFNISDGSASIWNVLMSFVIGVYMGVNDKLALILKHHPLPYILGTLMVFIVCGLATESIIPYAVREVILPIYPIVAVPFLIKISKLIPERIEAFIAILSGISYEIYLLHPYFIRANFLELFPGIHSLLLQVLIASTITCTLAFIFSRGSSFASQAILKYFHGNEPVSGRQ